MKTLCVSTKSSKAESAKHMYIYKHVMSDTCEASINVSAMPQVNN